MAFARTVEIPGLRAVGSLTASCYGHRSAAAFADYFAAEPARGITDGLTDLFVALKLFLTRYPNIRGNQAFVGHHYNLDIR